MLAKKDFILELYFKKLNVINLRPEFETANDWLIMAISNHQDSCILF